MSKEEQILKHLSALDSKEDCKMSPSEFKQFFSKLGMKEDEVTEVLNVAESDENGLIDIKKFSKWALKGRSGAKKVAICCEGTRGDAQPYVALGLRLQQAGYDVRFLTNTNHKDFVTSFGLNADGCFVDLQARMKNPTEMQSFMKDGPHGIARMMTEGDYLPCWKALDAYKPDVMTYGMVSMFHVLAWAEVNKVPAVVLFLQANVPSHAVAPAWYAPMGPPYEGKLETGEDNWAAWKHFFHHGWITGRYGDLIRAAIALDQTTSVNSEKVIPKTLLQSESAEELMSVFWKPTVPVIVGISESICVRQEEFSDKVCMVGFFQLEAKQEHGTAFGQSIEEVAAFVDAGSPPVYLGWGSMVSMMNEKEVIKKVVAALKSTGQRGILLSGRVLHEILDDDHLIAYAAENILFASNLPHKWLFPKCCCVVHHGGCGTSACGLMAGKPTVVVPVMVDQHQWVRWVNEQGLGVGLNGVRSFTSEELGAAITKCLEDKSIHSKVSQLAAKLQREDGAGQAVKLIDHLVKQLS
eukprot:TRINITY_DN18092_c0_g1_i1.p1 TRINITY_DN18092_c0_g1~~TRINITY_DN18092_c0_g1_i1.p1  ORF type:complete len:524 (-),score=87.38 TRINITY_DN18092_c0_g1_i1:63-1634(-)